MASNDPYPNDGYVYVRNRETGQYSRAVDKQCFDVLLCSFPIQILTSGIYGVGKTYDDLSEAGPIFWSKLTLYIISLT